MHSEDRTHPKDAQRKEHDPDHSISPAWTELANDVWAYENARVERWRNEINILLVFAGLFSAVVTAFAIQYYISIQPASPDFNTVILEKHTQLLERTAAVLEQISTQLHALSSSSRLPAPVITQSLVELAYVPPLSPPSPPGWIAALWFVALVFSLAAASVALAVNQWLNFHAEQAGLRSAPKKLWTWRLRRDALNNWKVELIVSVLPLLLQVALVLFLLGIVGYLGQLGIAIMVPNAVFVGVLFVFLSATSVIPAVVEYSPYKSPQAWLVCRFCRWTRVVLQGILAYLFDLFHPLDPRYATSPWRDQHVLASVPISLQRLHWGSRLWVSCYRFCDSWRAHIWRLRTSLHARQAYSQKLRRTSDWLDHEQLCLSGLTSRHAEETLFADVCSIALDTKVLIAIRSCLQDLSFPLAIQNAVAIGNARVKSLSIDIGSSGDMTRHHSRLQHDMLDGYATAMTGQVLLDTFIRVSRSHGGRTVFADPRNRYILNKLIHAMPTSDGAEICTSLLSIAYESLEEATVGVPDGCHLCRTIMSLVQDIYASVDFHGGHSLVQWRLQLCHRSRAQVDTVRCLREARERINAIGNDTAIIQITTIALTVFYAGSPKASTSTEEILADVHEELSENGILNGLRQFLASRSRAQMRLTISALSSADMLRFYVILNHICRRGLPERLTDVYSESMRRVALMINEIVRRLCWSMEDVVDHHSNVKTTWWLQHILQGCDRWLLPQERVSRSPIPCAPNTPSVAARERPLSQRNSRIDSSRGTDERTANIGSIATWSPRQWLLARRFWNRWLQHAQPTTSPIDIGPLPEPAQPDTAECTIIAPGPTVAARD